MKIKNKINKPHGQLEWLPSWEGVLKYDVEDIRNDRPIRLWHIHFVSPTSKRKVCEELKPILDKNKGKNEEKKPRVFYYFRLNKRKYHISRSVLTHLAYTGFDIVDRRHWVIDHINNISVDDRPSNLQCITQKENSKRSKVRKENNKLNNKERDRREKIRLEWLRQRRLELLNAMPYANLIDIELEAQRAYEEYDFTEDYKKKGGCHVEK